MLIFYQSGVPPIDSASLAPTESGAQLLRLPATDFERRCLKTPGVSTQQAKAFRSKLWQMHVDSQRAGNKSNSTQSSTNGSTEPDTMLAPLASSRDSNPAASEIPFKERIRPSMVVSWNESPGHNSKIDIPGDIKLAAVLCPLEAGQGTVKGVFEQALDLTGSDASNSTRYVCAVITPGQTADAYELNLWRQIIIDVSMMENEVILEYDAGTRYYYMSV